MNVKWALPLLVLSVAASVFALSIFGVTTTKLLESAQYFQAITIMLGAAATLLASKHVRVDIFYQRFSAKTKALVNLLGGLLLLLPVTVFIFFICLDYVLVSWQIMEKSSEVGGLPLVYLNKTLLLLMPVTLLLQGLAEIMRNLIFLLAQNSKTGGLL